LIAYQLQECFDEFLAGFEGSPQTIAELIDFNNANADKEFTQRLSPLDTMEK